MEPTEPVSKRIIEPVDTARSVGHDGQVAAAQELFRHLGGQRVRDRVRIGLTPMVQGVVVVNTRMHNIPTTIGNDWPLRTPGNARAGTS